VGLPVFYKAPEPTRGTAAEKPRDADASDRRAFAFIHKTWTLRADEGDGLDWIEQCFTSPPTQYEGTRSPGYSFKSAMVTDPT